MSKFEPQIIKVSSFVAEMCDEQGYTGTPDVVLRPDDYCRLGVAIDTPDIDYDAEDAQEREDTWAASLNADGWYVARQAQCCSVRRAPINPQEGLDADFDFSGPYATFEEARDAAGLTPETWEYAPGRTYLETRGWDWSQHWPVVAPNENDVLVVKWCTELNPQENVDLVALSIDDDGEVAGHWDIDANPDADIDACMEADTFADYMDVQDD